MQSIFWNQQAGLWREEGELWKVPCVIATRVPSQDQKSCFLNCLRAETSLDLQCQHTECFLRLNVLLFSLAVKLLLSLYIQFKCHFPEHLDSVPLGTNF